MQITAYKQAKVRKMCEHRQVQLLISPSILSEFSPGFPLVGQWTGNREAATDSTRLTEDQRERMKWLSERLVNAATSSLSFAVFAVKFEKRKEINRGCGCHKRSFNFSTHRKAFMQLFFGINICFYIRGFGVRWQIGASNSMSKWKFTFTSNCLCYIVRINVYMIYSKAIAVHAPLRSNNEVSTWIYTRM